MKIISWNVNSLNTILKTKYLDTLIVKEKSDILCFSETKLSSLDIDDYFKENYPQYKYRYWHNSKIKSGYSGTAIISKIKPQNIIFGLNYKNKDIDDEGRVITLELKNIFLIHVYTPNSGAGLSRLDYRINIWDRAFEDYINELQKIKPVIICGDLNVAQEPILDIKNPKTNLKSAGFTIEERKKVFLNYYIHVIL